jgi:putative membrane protein
MNLSKNTIAMLIIVASYMGGALIYALRANNFEFLLYICITFLIMVMVYQAHRKIVFTDITLWLLIIWGFLHMIGGLVPVPASWPIEGETRVLYSWWIVPDMLKYDNATHAFGFATATWCCWQGLKATVKARLMRPTFGRLTLVVMAGMGLGAMNEIFEVVAVLSVPCTNVGGYVNNNCDLMFNLAGCIIAALIIRISQKGSHH